MTPTKSFCTTNEGELSMAASLAEIMILGLLAAWVFNAVKIPGLIGMLLVGLLLGPSFVNILDPSLIRIGTDLRLIALIVILLRAGFELSRETLNRVGLQAFLMSFIPAVMEGAAITLLAPLFLGLSYMESAILGSVLAAVSPAVVVPFMIRLMEQRRGTAKGIPTLILAASSLDDVFVIVMYSVLIGIYTGTEVNIVWKLAGIPISIVLGMGTGLLIGQVLYRFFERRNPRATKRVLIVIGISILLVRFEHMVEKYVPFAALIAVMAIGFVILEKREHMAHEISAKLGKIWVFAEIVLFAMVGAQVNIKVALEAGLAGAALIFLALIVRSLGVFVSLIGSGLNFREQLFAALAYLPKATVQAAIGGAPLALMRQTGMETGPGEVILAVAVLSIVLTAPLGAWIINATGTVLLTEDREGPSDSLDAAFESDAGHEEDLYTM